MAIQKNIISFFLIVIHGCIFSSFIQKENSRKIIRDKEPSHNTLIQDNVFKDPYESGKEKYKELYQLIHQNITFDDGERVVFKSDDITYIFYKKFQKIESLGLGYRILISSVGRIDCS